MIKLVYFQSYSGKIMRCRSQYSLYRFLLDLAKLCRKLSRFIRSKNSINNCQEIFFWMHVWKIYIFFLFFLFNIIISTNIFIIIKLLAKSLYHNRIFNFLYYYYIFFIIFFNNQKFDIIIFFYIISSYIIFCLKKRS